MIKHKNVFWDFRSMSHLLENSGLGQMKDHVGQGVQRREQLPW